MSVALGEDFEEAVKNLSKDPTLKSVVVTGKGKAFSGF